MTDDIKTDIGSFRDTPSSEDAERVRAGRIAVISTADDEKNVAEPSSPNQGQVLYNNVDRSISGHIKEVDDTPGAERLFEMHKAGTFVEVHPDGTRVVKIYGDDFHISLQDNNLVVGGNLNITVQGDANILTKGNVKQKIGGDYDLTVHGNMTTRVSGKRFDYTYSDHVIQTFSNYDIRAEGSLNAFIKSSINIQTDSSLILRSSSTLTAYAEDSVNLYSSNNVNIRSDSTTNLQSSGVTYIDGSQVHLNRPGPGVSIEKPEENDPEDQDPTGGLTIEESTIEPSADSVKILGTGNNNLNSLINTDITFPKDRTEFKDNN